MKQTAVEWLVETLEDNSINLDLAYEVIEESKEMEKEQIIEFAEWLTYNRENNYTKSIKELLEIFKNK